MAAHSGHVFELAGRVGRALGLTGDALHDLTVVALLHDVGELAVPSEVLAKRGPLSDEEWRVVRSHVIHGETMAAAVADTAHLAPAVRASHERWDGAGYPDGLAGDQIPRASRITFVCDAYDAMTSERPHRAALSRDAALAEIRREAGRQFCPAAAGALVEVIAETAKPA
jgi:HD-GYP domain-containing protein (c-di-GMP phosphodiesterase class II)